MIVKNKTESQSRRHPNADFKVQGLKHFAFQVTDMNAAIDELRAKGVEMEMGPVDTPGVAFAFIRDNLGNAFELIQYKNQSPGPGKK